MIREVGIDLGTASVLVYVKNKGIVLREPSVVAVERNSGKVLAVGAEAQKMLGRTPSSIMAVRPLRDGVISDYEMTEKDVYKRQALRADRQSCETDDRGHRYGGEDGAPSAGDRVPRRRPARLPAQ